MSEELDEALRLADVLEKKWLLWRQGDDMSDEFKAAAELRRLHGEVEQLKAERDAAVSRANSAITFTLNCAHDENQPEGFRALALEWLKINAKANAAIDAAREVKP